RRNQADRAQRQDRRSEPTWLEERRQPVRRGELALLELRRRAEQSSDLRVRFPFLARIGVPPTLPTIAQPLGLAAGQLNEEACRPGEVVARLTEDRLDRQIPHQLIGLQLGQPLFLHQAPAKWGDEAASVGSLLHQL